jgi:hypothetical protein
MRLILCLGRLAGEHRQGDHETTSRAGRSDRRGRPGRLDGAVDGDAALFIHHEQAPEKSILGRGSWYMYSRYMTWR